MLFDTLLEAFLLQYAKLANAIVDVFAGDAFNE